LKFLSQLRSISCKKHFAFQWPINNEVYPQDDPTVGKLIKALQDVSIRKAQNSPRGTQLKLVFQLPNAQLALFKPQWYPRDKIVTGPVYSGKDRHTSEIVAFYLGAMLNFRWTPIAVGRRVSLKEIYSKGNLELQNTMLIKSELNIIVFQFFLKTYIFFKIMAANIACTGNVSIVK
jgi:glycosaminoglycan xylosylkinase